MKKKFTNILLSFLIYVSVFAQSNKKYIDFTLQNINGENVKLSDIVGKKIILLNFWTTWCPYCVKEIPELRRYYSEYKDKGLEIIAINIQESPTHVKNFTLKRNIDYPVVLDSNGFVANQYGVRGIPTNYLINKEGLIIFSGHTLPSEENIRRVLLIPNSQQKIPQQNKKLKK